MRRTCAPSSSGSRSTRRPAAVAADETSPAAASPTTSRSRTSATVRSTRNRAGCPPVVELGAVAQREAGEERSSGEGGRRCQVMDRRGACQPLELDEVDRRPRPARCRPAPGRPSAVRHPSPVRITDRVRRSAPRARRIVRVGPQQGRQLVASVRSPVGGEDDQDGDRLAGVDVEWRPVDEDLRCPEQADLQSAAVVTDRHARNDTTGEVSVSLRFAAS